MKNTEFYLTPKGRGEYCHEGVICKPKFNSNLSNCKIEVMRY